MKQKTWGQVIIIKFSDNLVFGDRIIGVRSVFFSFLMEMCEQVLMMERYSREKRK